MTHNTSDEKRTPESEVYTEDQMMSDLHDIAEYVRKDRDAQEQKRQILDGFKTLIEHLQRQQAEEDEKSHQQNDLYE